jgi:hypothetical protein
VACVVCGPIEAGVRARVIASMQPERFIVATLPQSEWGLSFEGWRRKIKRFRFTLSEMFGEVEWAWTLERGHQNGSPHVNLLQRGPEKLPQAVLQERWGGIVNVKRIRGSQGAARYALKEAGRVSGYALKEAGGNLDDHLALNGGRLAHHSRGYFGGERVADVRKRLRGESEWEWHPEAVTQSGALETWARRASLLTDALRNRDGA